MAWQILNILSCLDKSFYNFLEPAAHGQAPILVCVWSWSNKNTFLKFLHFNQTSRSISIHFNIVWKAFTYSTVISHTCTKLFRISRHVTLHSAYHFSIRYKLAYSQNILADIQSTEFIWNCFFIIISNFTTRMYLSFLLLLLPM